MPAYKIHNLTKRFGRTTALDALSFEAYAGEFLVILGPTGAGKTTLLRTLAGLEKPDTGTLHEDTTDITPLSPAQRDIAMVFQNFSLYPRLTVFDNLAFPLRPKWRQISPDEIKRRVAWAADLLGLTPKLNNRPTELSGGQQQRVAIGRAIVREPRLFLFDEPLASLDAKLRESMMVEIHRLQRRLGTTMLYVTHDHLEAMSLADRLLVLDRGRILQTGTPKEVYEKPLNSRIARMLGSPPVNVLTPRHAALLFSLPALPENTAEVGLRPEHLELTPDPNGRAHVRVVEHLGATIAARLAVHVDSHEIELRTVLPPTHTIAVGSRFTLHAQPQHFLYWQSPT